MDYWKNFSLSQEAQTRLKSILSNLEVEEFSNDWCTLMDINKSNNPSPVDNPEMDVDFTENDFKEGENFKNLLEEALDSNVLLPEYVTLGLSSDAYGKIFSDIRNNLDELKFSKFCDFIISSRNDILIEQALKSVVLPKLQEKKESTAYTIFAITKLVAATPEKFCNLVFIPLLTDSKVYFSDVELMSSVFPKLPLPCREIVLMNFTEKQDFRDSDWLLLQPVVKEFSRNSILAVTRCAHKHSSLFTKSQAFGKFLVSFCKNIHSTDDNKLLFEAVNTHQTLLKRQALKYLEKL